MNYLPEIKKLLSNILKQTNDLEKLRKKLNELECDEMIKDFTLHRFDKEVEEKCFRYDVKQDDFYHITDHIHLIQRVITPELMITAQTNEVDSFRIIFWKETR
jgi:predicted nuclease with TOPRIM domain